jgi:hypothetical protein
MTFEPPVMTAFILVCLIVVFILTSFISVVTGGTSLVTVPVMMQLGINPHVAVATNLFSSLVATAVFAVRGLIDWRLGLMLIAGGRAIHGGRCNGWSLRSLRSGSQVAGHLIWSGPRLACGANDITGIRVVVLGRPPSNLPGAPVRCVLRAEDMLHRH